MNDIKKVEKEGKRLEHLIGCMRNLGDLVNNISGNSCLFKLNDSGKIILIKYSLGDKGGYDEITASHSKSNNLLYVARPSSVSEIQCFPTKGMPIILKELSKYN